MGELSKCSAVNGGGVPRNFDFGMNIFELPTPSPPPADLDLHKKKCGSTDLD
jgi:hypothetical protein